MHHVVLDETAQKHLFTLNATLMILMLDTSHNNNKAKY
jgi:hypothetical protein